MKRKRSRGRRRRSRRKRQYCFQHMYTQNVCFSTWSDVLRYCMADTWTANVCICSIASDFYVASSMDYDTRFMIFSIPYHTWQCVTSCRWQYAVVTRATSSGGIDQCPARQDAFSADFMHSTRKSDVSDRLWPKQVA
jgi:hypothetical protein